MAPFVVLWLLSHGHLGALWLLIPALLCVVQIFRPTRGAWAVIFAFYVLIGGAYAVLLVSDLAVLLGSSGAPRVLVDPDDSLVFVSIEVALVALAVWLWVVRPRTEPERAPSGDE